MRRYFTIFVAMLFAAVSLFACSSKGTEAPAPAPAPVVAPPAPAPAPAPEVKKEEVKKPEAKPAVKTDKEVKKTKTK